MNNKSSFLKILIFSFVLAIIVTSSVAQEAKNKQLKSSKEDLNVFEDRAEYGLNVSGGSFVVIETSTLYDPSGKIMKSVATEISQEDLGNTQRINRLEKFGEDEFSPAIRDVYDIVNQTTNLNTYHEISVYNCAKCTLEWQIIGNMDTVAPVWHNGTATETPTSKKVTWSYDSPLWKIYAVTRAKDVK